ncbi:hypothetical protein QD357_19375 [Rhizobium sp. BR 317]|uniref:hypothetical protein n=1 Tax=Rhizobium sp. BR 317 TaxID=3040015 RepID=UPI0039C00145
MSIVIPFPLDNASDASGLSYDEVDALQKMLCVRAEIEGIFNRLTAIHNGIAAVKAEETRHFSEGRLRAGGEA